MSPKSAGPEIEVRADVAVLSLESTGQARQDGHSGNVSVAVLLVLSLL